MKGKLYMKNNFQQSAAQVELDDQELEQITGGCSSSHKKKNEKHLPPPPPHGKPSVHHAGQPPLPYPGQSGFPNGFGGHNGKC
jgi:hypothetical protein